MLELIGMPWKILPVPSPIFTVFYLLPFVIVIAISLWGLRRASVRRQDWLAILSLELNLMTITMSMMRF